MLGHHHSEFPIDYSPEQTFPAAPLFLAIPEHECLSALRSEMTSSGCSSYGGSPSSITSYGSAAYVPNPNVIPRSHSVHKNMDVYSDCQTSSVRKVLSAGDLQMSQRSSSSSPLVNESSIIESMNRANPYSPQEKKERIERYRSKRNLRNFSKKIKYECRKTLADSRPRIRGRFARNDEIDQMIIKTPNSSQPQWDNNNTTTLVDEDEEYDHHDQHNWIHFLDAFSPNLLP